MSLNYLVFPVAPLLREHDAGRALLARVAVVHDRVRAGVGGHARAHVAALGRGRVAGDGRVNHLWRSQVEERKEGTKMMLTCSPQWHLSSSNETWGQGAQLPRWHWSSHLEKACKEYYGVLLA